MKHSMFSWQARIPVAAGGYDLLDGDIEAFRRHVSRMCPDAEFVVRNEGAEVLIEGNVTGIVCATAWDLGAAIQAFAGRHAVSFFVYKTICNGRLAEHVMGLDRASSPGSRGERLRAFETALREEKLPRWAPMSCARLLDSFA